MEARSRKAKWVHGRSVHRQRSHDEAHAGAAIAPLPPIPQHPLVPQGEPAMIEGQSDLADHLARLRHAGCFAFDTEFIGEHSYHAKLCVIQTATADAIALIDPLASAIDIRGIWESLADPAVEKIVHAGEQDLEPVVRSIGRPPANVFDTQIVAAFCGCGYPTGMARLLRDLLNADPGAGLTFSQWDRRPLSRVQMLYAANDVRYLPLLRQTLACRAAGAGTLEFALDECRECCAPERFRVDPIIQRARVRGVEALSLRQLAILAELIAWRERAAGQQDVPPKSLVRDSILIDMTYNPVLKLAELDRVSDLPRPVEQRWGKAILEAIRIGLDSPLPDGLKDAAFDRWSHRRKVDKLWAKAAEHCVNRGIEPAIALSKREVGLYLRALDMGMDRQAAAGRLVRGWRREVFGEVF